MAYASLDAGLDTLVPGDILLFGDRPAEVGRPLNPGQFDYGTYLFNKGFSGTLYLRTSPIALRPVHESFRPFYALQCWREKAIEIFRQFDFEERELGVVSALVLGKRELVDPDTRSAYANAGTVHILAVSGLHVGIIYLFIAFVLAKGLPGKKLKLTRLLITLLLLWVYAGITGLSPSVLRAATMFSFIALGRHVGKFGSIYNMLGVSAFVLLLANPFLIKEVGFQLSYLAVAGIVYIYPKVFPLLSKGNWFWDKIWALLVVSFSAQIATFPLSIYYFNQFPNYFLLTNLLVIPLATVILYLGILTILGSWIPFIGSILALLLKTALKFLNDVIFFSSALPNATTTGLYFSVGATILVYLIILLFIKVLKDPRHGNLRILELCTIALLSMHAWSVYQRTTTSSIICLHIYGKTAIVAANGSRVHVWTDLYPAQLEKLNFPLSGYLNKLRPSKVTYSQLYEDMNESGIVSRSNVIGVGDYIMCIANETLAVHPNAFKRIDALLLTGKYKPDAFEELMRQNPKSAVVLDGSIPFYRLKDLLYIANSNNEIVWSVSTDGAYSLVGTKGF
jgi:competence protein ComEC